MTFDAAAGKHVDDDPALFALGALDDVTSRRVEAHLRTCAQCRQRFAESQDVVAALATPKAIREPDPALRRRVLTSAFSRKAPARVPSWGGALAAGFAIGIAVLLPSIFNMRAAMGTNDVALSTIVASHFNHAVFHPLNAGAPAAKVLYGRHGEWLYVVIHSNRPDLRVEAFSGSGSRRALPRPTIQGRNQTLFVSDAGRPARIEIDAGITPLAKVVPAYSR